MDDDGNLEKICPYCCKQTGKVINPKFLEWQLNNFKGKQPEEIFVFCPICNGTGYIPTSMGLGMLDFMDKYNSNAGGNA